MDAMSVETDRPDAAEATARIRERGERIRETEQARALDRLRARRDLSEREADVVRELADRLTDELLAVPQQYLDAVESGDADTEAASVALELFGDE